MPLRRAYPTLLTLAAAWFGLAARAQSGFNGVWKRVEGGPPEALILDQAGNQLRVYEFMDGRLAVFQDLIDGAPHSQSLKGVRYESLARWSGQSLVLETTLETGGPVDRVQLLLRLATGGKTMTVKRSTFAPRPATVLEKWEKQDPAPQDSYSTGFDLLRKLDEVADPSGISESLVRGSVAYAFNDLPLAERELPAIANGKDRGGDRDEARRYLANLYRRNGLPRQALRYCISADRAFFQILARYPEMSVTHREPARIEVTRDPEGRILLPVSAAGKEGRYLVDTGSNVSLLRASEAARLGLKPEALRRTLSDGHVTFEGRLAVVSAVTIGATRIENAPFWVVPDERLNWEAIVGIVGIDLLLKLETLRWNAAGEGEAGFPFEEKDPHKANLCFWGDDLMADVSSNGRGIIAFLDTGSNATQLYARFAAGHLDLLSAGAAQSSDRWSAHGAQAEILQLKVPQVILSLGGIDGTFRPAAILLEMQPGHPERHATIGMDMLNAAQNVTIDLHAMRLTLD